MKYNKNLYCEKFVTPFAKAETVFINNRNKGIFEDFAISNALDKVHEEKEYSRMSYSEIVTHFQEQRLIR